MDSQISQDSWRGEDCHGNQHTDDVEVDVHSALAQTLHFHLDTHTYIRITSSLHNHDFVCDCGSLCMYAGWPTIFCSLYQSCGWLEAGLGGEGATGTGL